MTRPNQVPYSYGSIRTEINGLRTDSLLEASWYLFFRLIRAEFVYTGNAPGTVFRGYGLSYRPDFHLTSAKIWLEMKGRTRSTGGEFSIVGYDETEKYVEAMRKGTPFVDRTGLVNIERGKTVNGHPIFLAVGSPKARMVGNAYVPTYVVWDDEWDEHLFASCRSCRSPVLARRDTLTAKCHACGLSGVPNMRDSRILSAYGKVRRYLTQEVAKIKKGGKIGSIRRQVG